MSASCLENPACTRDVLSLAESAYAEVMSPGRGCVHSSERLRRAVACGWPLLRYDGAFAPSRYPVSAHFPCEAGASLELPATRVNPDGVFPAIDTGADSLTLRPLSTMFAMPPVTQALIFVNGLIYLLQVVTGDYLRYPFGLWPLHTGVGSNIEAMPHFHVWQARHLRLSARQPDALVLQHAGAVHVRQPTSSGCGGRAAICLLLCLRGQRGHRTACGVSAMAARDSAADRRRIRRRVRCVARVRHDVPAAHGDAVVPARSRCGRGCWSRCMGRSSCSWASPARSPASRTSRIWAEWRAAFC